PEQIVIFGRSLGSAFATWLAGRVEARMVILETPFASMRHLFRAYFPFLPPAFFFKFLFPNYRWLKKVTVPVYIFQGDEDLVVPFKVAVYLKSSLKPDDRFFDLKGHWNERHFGADHPITLELACGGGSIPLDWPGCTRNAISSE
ncbi:MAG: hypothetical protein IPL49_18085, partial [Saprospirales bacterium]|nr:hypothetical protein [Saprospirales bacterium]